MKLKKLILTCILCFTALLFSGCDDKLVLFGGVTEGQIGVNTKVPINITFLKSNFDQDYKFYDITILRNGYYLDSETCLTIPTSTNKIVYNLDTTEYSIFVGNKLQLEVNLRTSCDSSSASFKVRSSEYSVVDKVILPSQDPLTETIELIGGDSHYCNVDSNGNYRLPNKNDNLLVRVAYSQIGYKEKAGNKNLNSCSGNAGSNNYQKYSGTKTEWSNYFVHWCLKKAGMKNPFGANASIDDIKTWAINNGRWHGGTFSPSEVKSGDLLVFNKSTKVGIIYKVSYTSSDYSLYVIFGDSKTSDVNEYWFGTEGHLMYSPNSDSDVTKISGYVNMKGISY